MIVVMTPGSPQSQIEAVQTHLTDRGLRAHTSEGVERQVIGVVGSIGPELQNELEVMDGVSEVLRISKPYKLSAREFHPEDTVITIGEAGGISLGLMFAVAGVGTGVGPILARRFTGDRQRSLCRMIILGYGLASLGLIISAPLINFSMVLFGTFLRGAGGGIIWVFSTQLLMQLVPNQVRGRVFSTEFAMFTLTSAIGAAVAGAILDSALGISGTIGWMAALTLVPGILWWFWMIKRPLEQNHRTMEQ